MHNSNTEEALLCQLQTMEVHYIIRTPQTAEIIIAFIMV